MKVHHSVKFEGAVALLAEIDEARARYAIPDSARIFEAEDEYQYRLMIEWTDDDL